MSGLKFFWILVMFLVLASQFLISETFSETSKVVAASALADADEAVVFAYQAVLRAEEAGANVSGLLVRLNEAGGFLARAHVLYTLGDFDESVRFADSSSDIAVEVENTAVGLKNLAFGYGMQRMWFIMVGSIVGVVLVVFGSFWSWRVFKRRYCRRVLGMSPEVISDES